MAFQYDSNGKTKIPVSVISVSGSLVILQPGIPSSSFDSPAGLEAAIEASASMAIEMDPDDKKSVQFRVPAKSAKTTNDRMLFYVSGSGKIGIGTKNPETAFDVRDASEDKRDREGDSVDNRRENLLKL